MSGQEAAYVTSLLTSGDEDDVIKGAGILSGVEAMVRVGEVQEGVDMERREEFISPRAANSRGRSEVGGGGLRKVREERSVLTRVLLIEH